MRQIITLIKQYIKIEFYNEHKDENYQFKIDPNIDLAEQNIFREANAILVLLFRDYFATEKQILNNLLQQNEKNQKKKKIYEYNDMFKRNQKTYSTTENLTNENTSELLLVEIQEEKWYAKILEFFRSIFRK